MEEFITLLMVVLWTEVSKNIKDLPKGSWIPQIKASKINKGEAILVANDYSLLNL